MAYIDKDKMLKYLDETHTDNEWLIGQYNADWIYSFIESQPYADVKEVVYAEWVECSNELNKYCSNCKKIHGDIYYKPPFCENCGATMIMKSGKKEQ